MRRITATATEIARRLEDHPAVELVRYPGYSGLISFDVADPRAVETRTRLIANATSLGGVNSTMESRHRWEGDRIPEGLLRLSVGLEDVDAALGRPRAGASREACDRVPDLRDAAPARLRQHHRPGRGVRARVRDPARARAREPDAHHRRGLRERRRGRPDRRHRRLARAPRAARAGRRAIATTAARTTPTRT